MTLAFVLGSPLGYALDLMQALPAEYGIFEHALVVGADSRFSAPNGTLVTDRGAKVWHLEPGISATFCGLVETAERGLSAFKRRLEATSDRSISQLAIQAEEAFDKAVPRDIRDGRYSTTVLIAVRTLDEMGIIRLESTQNFVPLLSGNPEVVGEPAACAAFWKHLKSRAAPRGERPQSPDDGTRALDIVSNGAILHEIAVACLRGAILEVGGTIGGPLQTAILNARGTETRTTLAADIGGLGTTDALRTVRLSANQDEVRGATGRDRRRILDMKVSDQPEHIIGLDEGPDGLLYVTRGGLIARRESMSDSA